MPFMDCQKDGKQGIKSGKSGICYTGQDAKKRANEQRKAIEASKRKR